MRLRDFIRDNRGGLVEVITKAQGNVPATASCYCHLSGTAHRHEPDRPDSEEIRQWILSDEGLYRWARSKGVKI